MKVSLLAAAVSAAAVVSTGLLATTPAQAAGETLTVNVASPFRPVSHVAAGGLYGLAENNRPSDAMLLPLKLNTLTQPAPNVGQKPNGQPAGGDSLLVAPQAQRVGAAEYIRMPDIYPNFPYQWVSQSDWNSKVDTMVRARLNASAVSNVTGWELWNEPDWTWNTSAAGSFNAGWVTTFRRIRALDTITPIVGPSYSYYSSSYMRSFLTYARDNNALPDVICWHELARAEQHRQATSPITGRWSPRSGSARGRSRSTSTPPRPRSTSPVRCSYIASLERGKVDNAERAFWYEYGTMNGLTVNNQPTGTYWLYKWYGDLAGNMVTTTPASQTGWTASPPTTRPARS